MLRRLNISRLLRVAFQVMRQTFTLSRSTYRFMSLYPRHALAVVATFAVMIGVTAYYASTPVLPAPAPVQVQLPASGLSAQDRALADAAFRAEKRGDYEFADTLIGQLDNQILVGHILGQRYLDPKYDAIKDELVAWLANYGDHPQAPRIKQLALRKGVAKSDIAHFPIIEVAPLKGKGYAEHLGRTGMPSTYYRGLALWKEKNYSAARSNFAQAAEAGKLNSWQKSAAYYWAYRASEKLGRDKDAYAYLTNAGQFPTTFYGQLANQQLGHRDGLIAAAPFVPNEIRNSAPVMRARALASVNQRGLAEDELRILVMRLPKSYRPSVLSVAGEIGLANLQVRLASLDNLSAEEKLYGNYPMPPWFVSTQTKVDPTLLMSIARQESVFQRDAKSHMGATGMMQMLPSTARYVEKSMSKESIALASTDSNLPLSQQLNDPSVNLHLGAEYLAHLSKQGTINGDAIRLVAAYNAGPGSVQSWQAASRNISDPLLYIESIPYAETRNYVMQVLAHQWVYQTLAGNTPYGLIALTRGQWPQQRV